MMELLLVGNRFFETTETAGLVFRTTKEALWYQSETSAVGPQEVLDGWPRSSNTTYFSDPSSATGDAADWTYDATLDSFVQPNNSQDYQQIFSPQKLDSYVLTSGLSSSDSDGDAIGIVGAGGVVSGELVSLVFVVHTGGNSWPTFSAQYFDSSVAGGSHSINPTEIAGNNYLSSDPNNTTTGNTNPDYGWWNRNLSIKVSRTGSLISGMVTDWDGGDFQPASEIVVDLSTLPGNGAQLANPSSYGFFSHSQANSTYLDYKIQSSQTQDKSVVYSENENKRWEYQTNSWVLSGNAYDDFSEFGTVENLLTDEIFSVGSSTLNFQRNEGIPYGTVSLNVASGGETFPEATFTNEYTYNYPLSVLSIFEPTGNTTVSIGTGDITINPNGDTSGSFHFKLKSPMRTDPLTGEETYSLAYRRCDYTVV